MNAKRTKQLLLVGILFQGGAHGLASQAKVNVWDNVLPKETCQVLHEAATESGLGHCVFRRKTPTTRIERALDTVLSQMKEPSQDLYVEYWSRQEWRHIEAHADVDEHLAKQETHLPFRYPDKGHVLYLQVGKDVRGPTCLFTNATSGGDLVECSDTELVTVPAVAGRLLQFSGDMLHAVPRPSDLWLLPFVKGAPQFQPQETWGRSVILFNTWSNEPPSNVPYSDSSDSVCEQKFVLCNPAEEWRPVPIQSSSSNEEERVNAKIWLLGDQHRREHMYRTVKMSAPARLRDVLNEGAIPQRSTLQEA